MTNEQFDQQEAALLAPFVTNLDQQIFGLRNLPEVVKGALFSRYSRSDKSLRRMLLDEFIANPEAAFDDLAGSHADPARQLIAVQQAEAFYERVLIGYGDDSVAELGGAHIACEGISNIAAKALEDSRIGIDPLEKSTRYVSFSSKVDGRYRYLREPEIMASRYADAYEQALDGLFDTYTALLEPLMEWLQRRTPRTEGTSQRAYLSATRAKALDLLRGLLPMATLTNVGLYGNGRAFEYLLTKLQSSPHGEVRQIGAQLQGQLDQLIPSFVKRAKTERGARYAAYLAQIRADAARHACALLPDEPEPADSVTLVDFDRDAEQRVLAAILYPHADLPLEQVRASIEGLSPQQRAEILADALGERESRFHKPGRAFEEARYTFDLLADIGAYRDLQRHRMLTQERQRYSVRHGYVTPPELEEAGLAERYAAALERAAALSERIAAELPEAAQYAVPFAFRVRWRVTINLRACIHMLELRSARQGHPSYRRIAQEMFQAIAEVHPALASALRFIDLSDYDLERLSAEQRLDEKLRARK